jgi:tetratricopeptide (TPR) repeat protein
VSFAKITWAGIALGIGALLLCSRVAGSGDTVGVRVLVVDSADEAARILGQLKGGADFGALAREKSTDATSVDGGFLGQVDPATLRPELRDALHDLRPGELSRIVKLPSGYAILKVVTETGAGSPDGLGRARQTALSAAGSVRYGPDVDGLQESWSALLAISKPDGWEQDPEAICEVHTRSYTAVVNWLEHMLDSGDAGSNAQPKTGTPLDRVQIHIAKGQLHAYKGEMIKAIEQWETAYRLASSDDPQVLATLEESVGILYLHASEMENDVYRNPGERCLFPMRPALRYRQTANSEKAVGYFLKCLTHQPDNIEAKWLLNLAEMTLGSYPDGVPPQYLMAPSLFASAESIGRFIDVAPAAGLNLFAMASGVIVDDFDNDGLLDVVTSSYDPCAPMHYFHNNGDGTFSDRTAAAGLSGQLGGLNLIQADYNNDGCLDVLILRGAWEKAGQRKSLLRNNCDGTFTDVTKQSGLAVPATNTQAAVWADINNDGLLDLFVVNESGPSQLFLNQGDGTFRDISHAAGIDRAAFSKGVAAADYDGDGYVDFYVSNMGANNFLYHNNHDGTFTEVAGQAGVPGAGRGFATWFFDYDNDGWPDLFVTSYYPSVDESIRTYLGLPHNAGTLKLYKNLGDGTFRDVTKETGLDKVFMPMGGNFGDVDNDGYPDIYLGTGSPSYGSLLPNVLLRNKEGKSFVDITASSGTGELHKGHGVAMADLDNDGDLDILASIGGAVPGDSHAFRLFENPGNGNDWIVLRLVGVKANRSAIGARIKVTVKNEGKGTRAIYSTVGSQSSFGGSPLRQHIGLGKSAQIQQIEIRWPGNPAPQTFSKVSKNQFIEIKEFATEYTKLDYRPYRLGGPNRPDAAGGGALAAKHSTPPRSKKTTFTSEQ